MRILRATLAECADLTGAVVAIDVLRSFSTAAYALAAGARAVVAVDTVAAAQALRRRWPGALTVGALAGGAPVPQFDLGNSPSLLAAHDLRGRTILQHTAGGVQALVRSQRAELVLAASLVCARATAEHLRAAAPDVVTLVVTGEWTDRDGDEDHACADYIAALLGGADPDPAPYAARVRASDFGRRFGSAAHPALPLADLECCAAADRFDFAMPVRRRAGHAMLLPARRPS